MNFNTVSEFLQMGGYGLYVWTSYGITLIVLGYNIINPMVMNRRFMKLQKQNLRREQAREIAQE